MADIGIDDTQELRDYAAYMKGPVAADMDTIGTYAKNEGCDKSGFTGLFSLLAPTMDLLSGAVDELVRLGKERLESSSQGLEATATEYERIEEGNRNMLDNMDQGA